MPRRTRTVQSLPEELPRLLEAAGEPANPVHPTSLRSLAEAIEINQSYISRILGAKSSRPVSRNVARRIAEAFGLPPDYFPEYRAAAVLEAARSNPALLDPIYDKLPRKSR